jgi:dolichol-phosphate mannosyltransferase
MISVVIPTYNEAAVIEETLDRAAASLRSAGEDFEIVVVDDASADGTAELVESLAGRVPVRVLRRPGRLGLATAVLDGWATARGDVWGVMDADLQHPPETLAALARAVREQQADVAIGSRYVPGGGTFNWNWARRVISLTASHMAATVLPLRLAGVADSGSGLFMVRASALRNARLNPVGYKILLEVLAKADYRKLVEVPYVFQRRERGSSKLGLRQYLEYIRHLLRLAIGTGQLWGWVRYGTVALVGAVIDVALFCELLRKFWPPIAALPVAIEVALLSNFVWNEIFTFQAIAASPFRPGFVKRLLRYEAICIPGALLNILVTLGLMARGGGILTSATVGVVAGGVFNFLVNVPAIWRTWGGQPPQPRVPAGDRGR